MDFREVLDFFGGSIFSGDYKIDFDQIRTHLQALGKDSDAQPNKPNDVHARLLLFTALYNLLLGNNRQAAAYLNQLGEESHGLSPKWMVRSIAYYVPLISWSCHPPLLRFRSEIGGISGPLLHARLDFGHHLQTVMDMARKLTNWADDLQRMEQQCFYLLSTASMMVQNQGCTAHPSYPQVSGAPTFTSANTWLDHLTLLSGTATDSGFTKLAHYLNRLSLEMEIAQSSPNLKDSFDSIRSKFAAAEDWAGLASIYMLEGDQILSPPFSSPIAMNLMTVDGSGATIQSEQWDAFEADMALNDNPDAQACYQKALALFDQAGATRGRAAIILRQGCVQHANALRQQPRSASWWKHMRSADEHISSAMSLFGLDLQNRCIATTHKILLSISSGGLGTSMELARMIGSWAYDAENPVIGQFCGLLMMKFGRRQWLQGSRSGIALLCYECAYECFNAMKDQYLAFKSIITQLELYITLSHHVQARVLADQAVDMFRSIIPSFKALHKGEKTGWILTAIGSLIVDTSSMLLRAYYYANDTKALEGWMKEVTSLDFESTKSLGTSLDTPELAKYIESSRGLKEFKWSSISQQRQTDQYTFYRYYTTDIAFQAALQLFDIDKAEKLYRDLLSELAEARADSRGTLDANFYVSIYTCSRLGVPLEARRILHRISDTALFKGIIRHVDPAEYNWSCVTHPTSFISPDEAENAMGVCIMARDWGKGLRVLRRIQSVSPGFLNIADLDQGGDIWNRFLYAALIAEHGNCLHEAFRYLLMSAYITGVRRKNTLGEDVRRASFFTGDIGNVYLGLARIALCFASSKGEGPQVYPSPMGIEMHGRSWREQALLFLEDGKARSLLDSMTANRSKPSQGSPSVSASLVYKRRLYLDLLAIPAEQRLQADISELDTLTRELNIQSGDIAGVRQRDTLLEAAAAPQALSFDDLCSAIPANAAVIEFTISQYGMVLFVITSTGIRVAQWRDLTVHHVRRLVYRYLREAATPCYKSTDERTKKLTDLTTQLSNILIGFIENEIEDKQHLIFVPSYPTLAFPFSALMYRSKPLFLSKAVSQVPSLATLFQLQKRPGLVKSPKVATMAKPGSVSAKATEPPLKMAGIEALTIATLFGQHPPIDVKNTTSDNFKDVLRENDIVHLSTHGSMDTRSPWQASISLRARFRVVDLTAVDCHASLVVFGACLSGLGKSTVGNDITGFSHLILSAGASTYVGALWRVDDVSTMLLMVLFYREMFTSPGISVAELWRRAQVRLYESDLVSAKSLLVGVAQGLDDADRAGWEPEKFVKKARLHLRNIRERLEMEPWDPFCWAPFVIVGNGSLAFDCEGKN